MRPILNDLSITRAAVRDDDQVAVSMVIDELAFNIEDEHAAIYSVRMDVAAELGFREIQISDLAYADAGRTLVAVGHYGEAVLFVGGATTQETINETETPIRGVAEIGRDIIACGTNLHVYRRAGPDNWVEFGPGAQMREEFPRNHLEAIDGYSQSEIYAAGRDGVIWWYDGAVWTPVQCATNLAFISIHCSADGFVYVGGLTGIVAKGRRDEFEVHTPPSPLKDIWGIQEYGGQVYCAMTRALMTWDEEDGLQPVAEAMSLAETFYNLGQGGTIFWSLGEKDVLRFDGKAWTRINEVAVA